MHFQRLLLLSIACAVALNVAPSAVHAKVIDWQGRKMEVQIAGAGSPVVVLENGLGARMFCWEKVLPRISELSTTFSYNRPGYGRSAAVTAPRDGATIVSELRELLLGQGLQPPYLLVGHSLGGLYMQLFARQYPREVSGLVLVDPTHPKQNIGPDASINRLFYARSLVKLLVRGTAKREFDAINQTGEEVLALPVPTSVPVILLTAKTIKGPVGEDIECKRADLCVGCVWFCWDKLNCGHFIQLENPQVVVAAVRDLLSRAKNW